MHNWFFFTRKKVVCPVHIHVKNRRRIKLCTVARSKCAAEFVFAVFSLVRKKTFAILVVYELGIYSEIIDARP